MNKITRDEVKEKLGKGIVRLEFMKKDGTIREMNATLDHSLYDYTPSENTKKKNEEVQPVWDAVVSGFRSFRWDSLLRVDGQEYINGN